MYGIKLSGTDLFLSEQNDDSLYFSSGDHPPMIWLSKEEAADYMATMCRIDGLEVVLISD